MNWYLCTVKIHATYLRLVETFHSAGLVVQMDRPTSADPAGCPVAAESPAKDNGTVVSSRRRQERLALGVWGNQSGLALSSGPLALLSAHPSRQVYVSDESESQLVSPNSTIPNPKASLSCRRQLETTVYIYKYM